MSDWRIERYEPSQREGWDEFVRDSRNGTFLFERGYMDYHADRFRDCSWMVWKGGRLSALLPANLDGEGVLHSHQGLTYGGWVLPKAHLDGADLLDIFTQAVEIWRETGIRELDYKPMPWIYAGMPSDEDIYALFRLGARETECNLSAAVDLREGVEFNTLQRRHLAKASKLPVEICELCGDGEIGEFMGMLAECLQERHGVRPVHTLGEMLRLRGEFPRNIRFFGARMDGRLEAGVCVYDTGRVAHAQYIATTARGREMNLLTPLFHWLMTREFGERAYFDFGISNEDHGRVLNAGLLRQKYSLGGRGVAYRRFHVRINNE